MLDEKLINENTEYIWDIFDGSQVTIGLNNNKKVYTSVNMCLKKGVDTGHVYEYKPMFQIASYGETSNRISINLNASNSCMLSTVFDIFTEDASLRKYFDKNTVSGWYVQNKYRNKPVFAKILSQTLKIQLVPYVDEKCVPEYKVIWYKDSETTEMILTKPEMQMISKMLMNFSCNASFYIESYKNKVSTVSLKAQFEKMSSMVSLLGDILNKLNSKLDKTDHVKEEEPMKDSPIEIPVVDTEPVEEMYIKEDYAYTVDEDVLKASRKEEDKKDEEEDSTKVTSISDILEKEEEEEVVETPLTQMIESKTGLKVVKEEKGYNPNTISVSDIYPDFYNIKESLAEAEPSSLNPEEIEKELKKFSTTGNIMKGIIKKFDIDVSNWDGMLKLILKTRLFDQNAIISKMVRNSQFGVPATAVTISIASFAAAYEYISKHPECDKEEVAIAAIKAIDLHFSNCTAFAGFKECAEYFEKYKLYIAKLVRNKVGKDMKYLFYLDSYIVSGKMDFCSLNTDIGIEESELICFVKALTDVYLLLGYADSKYLINGAIMYKNSSVFGVVNVQMMKFVRMLLVNLIVNNTYDLVNKEYAKSIIYFSKVVKAFSWEPEVYKEAVCELLAYTSVYKKIYKEIDPDTPYGTKVTDTLYRGLPLCAKKK